MKQLIIALILSNFSTVFANDLVAVSKPVYVVKQAASLTLTENNCLDSDLHFSSGILCEVSLSKLNLPFDGLDIGSFIGPQIGFYRASVIDGKIIVLSSFAATNDINKYREELNKLKSLIAQKKAKVKVSYIGNSPL